MGFEIELEKKRIEVVATDGIETRKLIWIEQDKDGSFYWGTAIPKSDFHSSYHATGEMHFSKYHEPSVWEPTSKFKGTRQLASFTIIKDFHKIRPSRFKQSNLDGIVYVDFRTHKGDYVDISLFLSEKVRTKFLQSLTKIFRNQTISLFKFTNLWLVITVY